MFSDIRSSVLIGALLAAWRVNWIAVVLLLVTLILAALASFETEDREVEL